VPRRNDKKRNAQTNKLRGRERGLLLACDNCGVLLAIMTYLARYALPHAHFMLGNYTIHKIYINKKWPMQALSFIHPFYFTKQTIQICSW
jgi:hypothetical protein